MSKRWSILVWMGGMFFFVELRLGNEKKHTYLAYITKSKTGPNRENRSYNQTKMCMCVEFFSMELAPLSAWLYLLFWDMGYPFFSLSHASGHRYFSSAFLSHSSYYFLQHEESYQSDGVFLCGWKAYFCATFSVEVGTSICGVFVILIFKAWNKSHKAHK